METFVERAAGLVDVLGAARSRRAFLAAAGDVERMLAVVPDYPGTFFHHADYAGLTPLVDRAVEYIEARLAARTDRAAVQRRLATTIYRLRADMEGLYLRLHHEAARPPVRPRGAAVPASSR